MNFSLKNVPSNLFYKNVIRRLLLLMEAEESIKVIITPMYSEDYKLVDNCIKLLTDYKNFSLVVVNHAGDANTYYITVNDNVTVTITTQTREEVLKLEDSGEFFVLYSPYTKTSSALLSIANLAQNKKVSAIEPYTITTNTDESVVLDDYVKIAVINKSSDVVNYFVVDKLAVSELNLDKYHYIISNGRPYCAKLKKFVVDLLFDKELDEEFVYLLSQFDLRFRSIGVGDRGAKFLSNKNNTDRVECAIPTYWKKIENFHDLRNVLRQESSDLDEYYTSANYKDAIDNAQLSENIDTDFSVL